MVIAEAIELEVAGLANEMKVATEFAMLTGISIEVEKGGMIDPHIVSLNEDVQKIGIEKVVITENRFEAAEDHLRKTDAHRITTHEMDFVKVERG